MAEGALKFEPSWSAEAVKSSNQLDDAYLDAKATTAFLADYEDQLRKILIQSGQKLVR